MSEYLPAPYGVPASVPRDGESTCGALASLALTGAVVGGSAAAAHCVGRVQRQEMELTGAILTTGRSAVASAVATAVAGAAAGAVAEQGVLRLSLMFGVGAVVLHGINTWIASEGEGHE